MGQQQLLLLVLCVITVGLAVIVGIYAFSRNQTKANADAMVNEALRIAADVQAWTIKPSTVGGRLDNETLAHVTFDKIGYPNSGGGYQGIDGDFTLSTTLGAGCDTPHVPSQSTPLIYVNVTNSDTGNNICVAIAGSEGNDIGTDATYGNGVVP